jgi:hypothetical protein
MLATTVTPATLAEMYRNEDDDPATAIGYELGSTTEPEYYVLPACACEVDRDRSGRKTAASSCGSRPGARASPATAART